jgi:hypothetical protein
MAEALARQQQWKNDATKIAMKIPIFHGSSKDDTMDMVDQPDKSISSAAI